MGFAFGFQVLFSTEYSTYKCYVLHLTEQIKCSASEPPDIASPCKILEVRFLLYKTSFAYFHFLRGEKMVIGSRVGVGAGFRFSKLLSICHKIGCEIYSISNDTIVFLFNFARSILITTWRFNFLAPELFFFNFSTSCI